MRINKPGIALLLVVAQSITCSTARSQVNYEEPPISYSSSSAKNVVEELSVRLGAGKAEVAFAAPRGFLDGYLREFGIDPSSQVLVFSKTSLQRDKIGPTTPRAIYFNDEVHVGYVPGGVLEIAVADPELGMVFYTSEQRDSDLPHIQRETNRCMTCHGAVRTGNVPGLLVRSVFTDKEGQPVVSAGSFLSTHASPFEQRWGGWYVTGEHGDQRHLGNFRLAESKKPTSIDNSAGSNVRDLSHWVDTGSYLRGSSDVVALMVLEHQVEAYNRFTRAIYEARAASFVANSIDSSTPTESSAIKAREDLVRYLLFQGEAKLSQAVIGTPDFAETFTRRGPRDHRGRSLRDFDLTSRLFKYPCSYLLYSEVFRNMPSSLRRDVCRRIEEILSGQDSSPDFGHLSPTDRIAILEILRETHPDFHDRP